MLILPAIDIKDGHCVRLRQGKMMEQTVYSDDPAATARRWEAQGAEFLHVVDLNGAVDGRRVNFESIRGILGAVRIPVQVGGGIRDLESVEAYLSAGASRVVLGTAAIQDRELLQKVCERYPGRIVVALDSRDGLVAIRGWQDVSEQTALEVAKELEGLSPAALLVTDIQRDGMLSGPNLPVMRVLVGAVRTPIIASGGVGSLKDIEDLMEVRGLYAVVVGKALYEGKISLKEALALAGGGR